MKSYAELLKCFKSQWLPEAFFNLNCFEYCCGIFVLNFEKVEEQQWNG